MNETLQTAFANIINQATSGINKSISFLSDQLPDVVHQLLMWKFTESLMQNILSLLAFVIIGVVLYRTFKEAIDYSKSSEGLSFFLWFLACVGLILPTALYSVFNLVWLQILIAPKIYLIEFAKTLISGN